MPTIEDVAKLAGVSIATVSRTLSGKDTVSEKTRAKVISAADQLGYVPSQNAYSLATGRHRNIGIVIPYITNWFFSTMVSVIQDELLRRAYDATIYILGDEQASREKVFNELLLRKRVDGVLTVAVKPTEKELANLRRVDKPIIGVGGEIPGATSFSIDDREAGRLATEHLLSLGHTKIGIITGSPAADSEFSQPILRRFGYEEAMEKAGLEIHNSWFAEADFNMQQGYHATKQFFGNPRNRPTAIFCAADELAFGAILAVRDIGLRVPEDVSIIGVDNHDLSGFFGLTTISQDVYGQAHLAVNALMTELDALDLGEPVPVHEISEYPLELVVRSSTSHIR